MDLLLLLQVTLLLQVAIRLRTESGEATETTVSSKTSGEGIAQVRGPIDGSCCAMALPMLEVLWLPWLLVPVLMQQWRGMGGLRASRCGE